jgi:flagellar motor switch/type III secretory pathway protein FliN
MGPGSIVSLDTESGGQLALFSGNKLLGRAEIVIVEGKPALRITHIESDPQRN